MSKKAPHERMRRDEIEHGVRAAKAHAICCSQRNLEDENELRAAFLEGFKYACAYLRAPGIERAAIVPEAEEHTIMTEVPDIENEIGLPFSQIYSVWRELHDAFQGKNGYGGTVAEIYAYRLTRSGPADTRANYERLVKREAMIDHPDREALAREAAATLTKLLRVFAATFPCEIGIEREPRVFSKFDPATDVILPFDHRVHVEITPLRAKLDLGRARRGWVELGKALDSAPFQPPEQMAWLDRASDALIEISAGLFGGDYYDLVSKAFGVSHDEAKRKILAAAYGGKFR